MLPWRNRLPFVNGMKWEPQTGNQKNILGNKQEYKDPGR